MAKKNGAPSEFELQILGVLWRRGPSTVREILELLSDGKKRAYTSVLSVMQVMEKKGLLDRQPAGSGLAHVYRAKVTQRTVMGPMLRGLVTKVFGGSSTAAVQQLLSGSDVDADEIAQIRELLNEIESGKVGSARTPKKGST